ncbi:MAG TPA: 1,6-anhydro-N-acetylmuramyl-L-alanine amidase AmpD [Burkholderiales bacterium]|nr:1,6-anhydro-N-acetylmuramyl-L-alanine amidase AmpD [Burkholderiales bacterium]
MNSASASGFLDEAGVLSSARQVPSPNCDVRPDPTDICLLVVHSISLPPGEYGGPEIEALFTNQLDCSAHPYFEGLRGLKVSAHFLIRRDGELIQFVPCSQRAWHAGASQWRGRERCNDFSIGVELEGMDDQPFAAPQYTKLIELGRTLMSRYPIEDVVGHSDIAPGRKTDPGAHFDWSFVRTELSRSTG